MPFRNGSFDKVFACETTYFWPGLRENMRECRRVLKDEGRMVLVQEAWDAPRWRERNGYWQKGFNMRLCTPEEYEPFLNQAGFSKVTKVTEEEECGFVMVAAAEGN